MKYLFATLLAAAASYFGLSSPDAAATDELATPCITTECDAVVEPLGDGTCRIECITPEGEECWAIVACEDDGSCEVLSSSENCAQLAECLPAGECAPREECVESTACGAEPLAAELVSSPVSAAATCAGAESACSSL